MKFADIKTANRTLWALGFFKIPLIFSCRPRILEINDERCQIKIPFKRKVKNHVQSMYIGALTIGADVAAGFLTMRHIEQSGKNIVLIFKDMKAEYLKLVQSDAIFTCMDGEKIKDIVELAASTGERQNIPVNIVTTVPDQFGQEPVAVYTLTLSVKVKE